MFATLRTHWAYHFKVSFGEFLYHYHYYCKAKLQTTTERENAMNPRALAGKAVHRWNRNEWREGKIQLYKWIIFKHTKITSIVLTIKLRSLFHTLVVSVAGMKHLKYWNIFEMFRHVISNNQSILKCITYPNWKSQAISIQSIFSNLCWLKWIRKFTVKRMPGIYI